MAVASSVTAALLIGNSLVAYADSAVDNDVELTELVEALSAVSEEDLAILSDVSHGAREAVVKEFDLGSKAADKLESLIDETLDLTELNNGSDSSPELDELASILPALDSESVGGSLASDIQIGGLHMSLAGAEVTSTSDGVAVGANSDTGVSGIAHITSNAELQILAAIQNPRAGEWVDFDLTLPLGTYAVVNAEGEVDIFDVLTGEQVGIVAAPWAVTDAGVEVETYYELTPSGIRQHITQDVEGTLIIDPNVGWWIGTSIMCAGQIAVTFVPGSVAVKLGRAVTKINAIARTSAVVKNAVARLGGALKAATVVVKLAINNMRSRLPASIRNRIPSFSLTAANRTNANSILRFIGGTIWEIAGLGSCGALINAAR